MKFYTKPFLFLPYKEKRKCLNSSPQLIMFTAPASLLLSDDSVRSRNKLNETGDSCFILRMKFLMTGTILPSMWIDPRKNRKRRALSSLTCDFFAIAMILACLLSFFCNGASACCNCLTPSNDCTEMWVFDWCWCGKWLIDAFNYPTSVEVNIHYTL